jgi:hypothetical protein
LNLGLADNFFISSSRVVPLLGTADAEGTDELRPPDAVFAIPLRSLLDGIVRHMAVGGGYYVARVSRGVADTVLQPLKTNGNMLHFLRSDATYTIRLSP